MKTQISHKKEMFVILLLTVLYAISNYYYLSRMVQMPLNDFEAFYFKNYIDFSFSVERIKSLKNVMECAFQYRSPVYYLPTLIVSRFSNLSLLILKMPNIMWFFIMLLGLYQLGKSLFSRETAIYSILILSLYPAVYGYSRFFNEAFALQALVPWSLLYIFKSRGFHLNRDTAKFFVITFIAIFIRSYFLLFIIGPLVYILLDKYVIETNKKKFFWKIVLMFCLLFILFLFSRPQRMLTYLFEEQSQFNWWQFEDLRVYTIGIINYQLTLPFFILFIAGLIFFLKRADKKIKRILLSWILIPLAIFIVMPHRKQTYYITPYLPALALISAFGLEKLRIKYQKYVICAILLVGLLQYYAFSFAAGNGFDKIMSIDVFNRQIPYFYLDYSDNNTSCYPLKQKDLYSPLLEFIKEDSLNYTKPFLTILPTKNFDLNKNIRLYLLFNGYIEQNDYVSLKFKLKNFLLQVDNAEERTSDYIESIRNSDYILVSEDNNLSVKQNYYMQFCRYTFSFFTMYPPEYVMKKIQSTLANETLLKDRKLAAELMRDFVEIKRFYYSEQSSMVLLARRHQPAINIFKNSEDFIMSIRYGELGEFERGISAINKYLTSFPSDVLANVLLSEYYYILSDFDSSIKQIMTIINDDAQKDLHLEYLMLSKSYLEKGNINKCKEYLNRASDLNSDISHLIDEIRGKIYLQQNDWPQARKYIHRAMVNTSAPQIEDIIKEKYIDNKILNVSKLVEEHLYDEGFKIIENIPTLYLEYRHFEKIYNLYKKLEEPEQREQYLSRLQSLYSSKFYVRK